MNTKTTIFQKLSLILFGTCSALVIIELSLNVAGFTLSFIQETRNIFQLRDTNAYRILCVGESTTQGCWPRNLQDILNKTSKQFRVIDKGLGGTNTSKILQGVEAAIRRYKPQMIITMMGINDYGAHLPIEYTLASASNKSPWYARFKSYKLLKFLKLHLATVFQTNISSSGIKDVASFLGTGQDLMTRAFYFDAEKTFWNAIKIDPFASIAYKKLRACYDEVGNYDDGVKRMKKLIEQIPENYYAYVELAAYLMNVQNNYDYERNYDYIEGLLNKAIALNPIYEQAYIDLGIMYITKDELDRAEETFKKMLFYNPRSMPGIINLACLYRDYYHDWLRAEEVFNKALEIEPDGVHILVELGRCYMKADDVINAERTYKKVLTLEPKSIVALRALATLYEMDQQEGLATSYLEEAESLSPSYYPERTVSHYLQLAQIAKYHNIALVCVQYPMRQVEQLKGIFNNSKELNIHFVDNEITFKEAVKKEGYSAYFIDNFAGDFGHCTVKGDDLIAENIARVILNEVLHIQ